MTAIWTAADAARATGGISQENWAAQGVSIDSRSISPGDLFVALEDQRDGHEFVASALAKGAAAALVSRIPDDVPDDAPLLIVPDVLKALWALGTSARARTPAKVIAVTGSVGKTGTKEMLRTALVPQGRVHAAEKSFNNQWGVPLTLARMPRDTDYAIIEIGMSAPGEIAPLARLTRPHVAIVTNIAPVHMAAFSGLSAIAREKAAIFDGLEPEGHAIINRDDECYATVLRKAKVAVAQLVRFGQTGRPEFLVRRVFVSNRCTSIKAVFDGRPLIFKLGAPGRHLAMNAVAVLAAVKSVGADVDRAAMALARWHAPAGRGARWRIGLGDGDVDGAIMLIDESYNANPRSMEAAIEVLASAQPESDVASVARGRRIAFLSDMLELGPEEASLHASLSKLPGLAKLDVIHTAGPLMKALHKALPGNLRGEWYENSAGLAARARKLVDAGDVAMVKGSLGSRASLIVDAIKNLGDARAEGTG